MGFVSAVIQIDGPNGRRVDSPRLDGTYDALVLQLSSDFTYTVTREGSVSRVALALNPSAVVTASEVITDVISIQGKGLVGIGEATTIGAVTSTILTIGVPEHSSVAGTFEIHARHRGSTAGLLGGAVWPGVIAAARGTGSAEDNSSVGAAYIDPTGSEVDGANANGSISGSVNWILQVNGIAATTIDWLVFYRVSIKATA